MSAEDNSEKVAMDDLRIVKIRIKDKDLAYAKLRKITRETYDELTQLRELERDLERLLAEPEK